MKKFGKNFEKRLEKLSRECLLDKRCLYSPFIGPLRKLTMPVHTYEAYACEDEYVSKATEQMVNTPLSELVNDGLNSSKFQESFLDYRLFWILFYTSMNRFKYATYFQSNTKMKYTEISYYTSPPINILNNITASQLIEDFKRCCFLGLGISDDMFNDSLSQLKQEENISAETITKTWSESFNNAIKILDFNKPLLDLYAIQEIIQYANNSGEFEEYDGLIGIWGIREQWPKSTFLLTPSTSELWALSNFLIRIDQSTVH